MPTAPKAKTAAKPKAKPKADEGAEAREAKAQQAAEAIATPPPLVSEPDAPDSGGDQPDPNAGLAHDLDGTG